MVRASLTTGVTVTSSGWLTNPLTTYSRKACISQNNKSSNRHGGLGQLLDKAGDGVAGLGAMADPILGALQVYLAIIALFHGLITADLLDKSSIPRTAGIGHDNAVIRGLFGPDPFQTNSDCHNNQFCDGGAPRQHQPHAAPAAPKRLARVILTHLLGKPCFSDFLGSSQNRIERPG